MTHIIRQIRILCVVILVLIAPSLTAHSLPPTEVDVRFEGDQLVMEIPLVLEELIADMTMQLFPDGDAMAVADQFDFLVTQQGETLIKAFEPLADSFILDFNIYEGDTKLAARIVEYHIPEPKHDAPRETIIRAVVDLPPDPEPITIGWGEENGDLIIVYTSTGQVDYLVAGAMSQPIAKDLSNAIITSPWQFMKLGFLHIVPRGLDHILFVLGLFFYTLSARALFTQATVFTVAHSITLALATFGLISASPDIVEPLIALSIVYIAVENIFFRRRTISSARLAVIFAFGLIHGMGFAGILLDLNVELTNFFATILSFNIGVELGQIAILAVAFLLIGLPFGSQPYYTRAIANPASAAIGIIGVYWFISRIIG